MALQKREVTVSVTENDLVGMHQLIVDNIDSVAPESDTRLRFLLKQLGKPPMKVGREENTAIELRLRSLWEGTPRYSNFQF